MQPPAMAKHRWAWLFLAIIAGAASKASAQAQLQPGDTVRIWAPQFGLARATGRVRNGTDARLEIVSIPGDTAVVIPFAALTKLEVTRGFQRRTRPGAGVGLLVGMVVGGVITRFRVVTTGCVSFNPFDREGCTDRYYGSEGPLIGMVAGAGLGALIGSHFRHTRWLRVQLYEAGSTATPVPGLALTAAVSLRL